MYCRALPVGKKNYTFAFVFLDGSDSAAGRPGERVPGPGGWARDTRATGGQWGRKRSCSGAYQGHLRGPLLRCSTTPRGRMERWAGPHCTTGQAWGHRLKVLYQINSLVMSKSAVNNSENLCHNSNTYRPTLQTGFYHYTFLTCQFFFVSNNPKMKALLWAKRFWFVRRWSKLLSINPTTDN